MELRYRTLGVTAGALLLTASVPTREWQLVNPQPTAADLEAVACSPSDCSAVGEAGTLLASADGITWRAVASPTTSDLRAVTWSGSAFVAVGEGGTVLTSRDNESWVVRNSGVSASLEGICAGPGGLLVAVGEAGTLLTSTDGLGWHQRESGCATTLRDVVWAGSAFVAVGDVGPDAVATILTSRDAVTWVPDRQLEEGWYGLELVAAHGDQVVIGGPQIGLLSGMFASGGLGELQPVQGEGLPTGVAWCGDRWAAVSHTGHSVSFDGVEWEGMGNGRRLQLLEAVACGPAGPVAVGPAGQIASSPDGGVHWRRGSGGAGGDVVLASNGERLVAVTTEGEGWSELTSVESSGDGATWTSPVSLGFWPVEVIAGNGRFMIFGIWSGFEWWQAGVYSSSDGLEWSPHAFGDSFDFSYVSAATWDGTRFVAVDVHRLYLSSDGETWTEQETSSGLEAEAVASDGATLVAVTEYGAYRLSGGSEWEDVTLPVEASMNDIAYGAGRFVAVGERGTIVSSADGLVWQQEVSGTDRDLVAVESTDAGLVAVGAGGTVLESGDGHAWRVEETGFRHDLLSAAQHRCGLVVSGRSGLIARTLCGDDEAPLPAFTWRPPDVVAGTPVRFVDLSSGSPDRWRWELGDGTAATGPEVVHAWAAPGTYPVTLQVGNRSGMAAITHPVEVLAPCGAVGVPSGLSAPAQVADYESVTISWDPVEGADSYRVEKTTCEPLADHCAVEYVQLVWSSWWSSGSYWSATLTIRVQSVRTCFDGDWRSDWTQPVTVDFVPTAARPRDFYQVLPIAANGQGAADRPWSTDVVLRSRSADPVSVALFPLDGAPRLDKLLELDLAPGERRVVHDVLGSIPGASSTCGVLLGSDGDVELDARSSSGVAAEEIPVSRHDEAVDEGLAILPGLVRDGTVYTNLGMTNATSRWHEGMFVLYDSSGGLLALLPVSAPPFGSTTVTDVFATLGLTRVAAASAVVSHVIDQGKIVAWSSVVDRASGDAVTRLPVGRPPRWGLTEDEGQPGDGALAFGGGHYVRIAGGLDVSTNGRDWHHQPFDLSAYAVAWNGSSFVAVGNGVARSSDGEQWEQASLPFGELVDVAWGGGQWLAVGSDHRPEGQVGVVGRSGDGLDWQLQELPEWPTISDVVWIGTGFVAASGESLLLSGADGSSWTEVWTRPGAGFGDLAWNGSAVIATGNPFLISSDGVSWETVTGYGLPGRVIWTGERFVGSGYFVSPDGREWTRPDEPGWSGEGDVSDLAWDGAAVLGAAHHGFEWLVEHGPALVVPGAMHTTEGGLSWRTDLFLTNTGSEPVACSVDALGADGPTGTPLELTIPGNGTTRLDDVLGAVGVEGEGAVRIVPSERIVVGSGRTWAATAAGTVGRPAPALPEGSAIWHFAEGHLLGLERSDTVRTDLGLISLCDEPMTVDVLLTGSDGAQLGRLQVALPAHSARTEVDVLARVGAVQVEGVAALLTTDSLACPFLAFATVVDSATGDSVLLVAKARPPGWGE